MNIATAKNQPQLSHTKSNTSLQTNHTSDTKNKQRQGPTTRQNQRSNQQQVQQQKDSPIAEMLEIAKRRPQLSIKRGVRGYGFTLRAIKVYYDDTDFYTIQHFVIEVDTQGPAYQAGLRKNDIITHVNDVVVCGRMHHEIVKLILSSVCLIFFFFFLFFNFTFINHNHLMLLICQN